ncbi:MAG: hypothetical protein M1835_004611 [Candelina submexicana]|nr:MAG: hypothetical protein M1835_004611 [Candelina submexicana]
MSIFHSVPLSQQQTSSAFEYDHQISLIDSTKSAANPRTDATPPSSTSSPATSKEQSLKGSGVTLGRKWTLREELARRKYSKWQEGKFPGDSEREGRSKIDQGDLGGEEGRDGETAGAAGSQEVEPGGPSLDHRGRSRQNILAGIGQTQPKLDTEVSEIDVLYENQRGSFFCGIPLYSHKSLLNFDPSPWVNASFKDSPVDITNAQVPDPTWDWAWKSWYVDMSADVDEEGWQYSFSFQPAFSWHGAHVWFHAFVRRRRWLRKRVKKHKLALHGDKGARNKMREGHMLTADYFTIHASRDRSVDSSVGSQTLNRNSYASNARAGNDEDVELDDIRDIVALLKALKKARIDRERIEAIEGFLVHGGEDIFYLAEKMPEIMSFFIFQNSRRQMLANLSRTFEETSRHRNEHIERGEPEDEVEKREIDNLLNAVKAADEQVKRLEYWSDAKDVASQGEVTVTSDDSQGWGHQWKGSVSQEPSNTNSGTQESAKPRGSDASVLPQDATSSTPTTLSTNEPSDPSGKGKAKE